MEYNENDVCCVDCGVKHLISIGVKPRGSAVTANNGICCVCGEEKTVISIRHYNYLRPKVNFYNNSDKDDDYDNWCEDNNPNDSRNL